MLSGNQSSKYSQTAEYDSFEICLSGCCDDLLRMLRRLAAANPNNVKLEKFYSSIYRGPVLIQGDKKGDKYLLRANFSLEYLLGTGVFSRTQVEVGDRCPTKGKKELSLARTTCLADKTNHPVKGLSLNRSQYGSCSTKYDTPAGT